MVKNLIEFVMDLPMEAGITAAKSAQAPKWIRILLTPKSQCFLRCSSSYCFWRDLCIGRNNRFPAYFLFS